MRLSRKHRMIGIQFWGTPVDGLTFDREFLEGPAGGARVAATGRRCLGHQPCGKDRQSGDDADQHQSFHFGLQVALAATRHASPDHVQRPCQRQSFCLDTILMRDSDPACYSNRSACIGGIDAARLPGISAATNAHSVSDPVATASATGSENFTPYNCAASNFPAPIASGTPSPSPIATRVNALRRTRFNTAPLSAPSAIRIPISFVLCATE